MTAPLRAAIAAVCALLLAGCVSPSDFDTGGAIRSVSPAGASKDVLFATVRCSDRDVEAAPEASRELLRKRCWDIVDGSAEMKRLGFGVANGRGFYCGTATVHLAGAAEDTLSDVSTPVFDTCDGFGALKRAIAATACKCAMIFVHGYNTTFGFGVKRTAQLAVDLPYEGVPIFYSFGASGRSSDYVNDGEAAELAVPALEALLIALSADPEVRIDLIAHSMGSRLALRAIVEGSGIRLNQVVLAAPDIDAAAFLDLAQKATDGTARAKRITVYTAKYDGAMAASAVAHAGRERVGEGLASRVVPNVVRADIINASSTATTGYGHSYFAESRLVMDDMRAALAGAPLSTRLVSCEGGDCKIPCPDGDSCSPSLYLRFVRWLSNLL